MRVFLIIAAWVALAGCTRSSPCAKLAKAICDGGERDRCEAFVEREMVSGDGKLTPDQTQSACALVLADPKTVGAMKAALSR